MEVARDDAATMVDVHHVPREEKTVHERNDSAIRGADRITHIALEVDAEVSARDLSVEDAPRAERARDARRARTEK